ncbi:hypothetical protein YPPY92_3288, partial [Yersinia pestis PY-92]
MPTAPRITWHKRPPLRYR